ncbi:MAG: hypothetical protein BGN82_08120 [Alphaproteobacteria bacterium 65-7]|nr:MAG: hypothetical protein BGN82_08120 [Alphaproteobacteria bacterium 65-7]
MFSFKSVVGAVTVLATVSMSTAFAADTGALAPGKPAGVQQAQIEGANLLLIGGVAAVALGVGLVVSDQSPDGKTLGPITTGPAATAP